MAAQCCQLQWESRKTYLYFKELCLQRMPTKPLPSLGLWECFLITIFKEANKAILNILRYLCSNKISVDTHAIRSKSVVLTPVCTALSKLCHALSVLASTTLPLDRMAATQRCCLSHCSRGHQHLEGTRDAHL